jgi:hypothetical protein
MCSTALQQVLNVQYCATSGTECAVLRYSRYGMCSNAPHQVLNAHYRPTSGTECAVLRYIRY